MGAVGQLPIFIWWSLDLQKYPRKIFFAMPHLRFLLFLLLTFIFIAETYSDDFDDEVCEAPVADSCFTDVADDLRFVFDPAENFLEASNETALSDLCDAWFDSLNCTRDVIDDTCVGKGKMQFDVWNDGLFGVVEFLCSNGMANIQAVANSVKCWSILKFLQCVETEADLTSVGDLLKTPQTKDECEKIQNVTFGCNILATNSECDHHMVIYATLNQAFDVFFHDIHCDDPPPSSPQTNDVISGSSDSFIKSRLFLNSIFSLGIIFLITTSLH